VSSTVEKKSQKKNYVDDKRQQKEKNSWLGGLAKFWKPSNNTDVNNIKNYLLFYVDDIRILN